MLKVEATHDAAARTVTLTLSQKTPLTPGQPEKAPTLIPVRTALLGPDGSHLPLRLQVSKIIATQKTPSL